MNQVKLFETLKKFEGKTNVIVNQENKGYQKQIFPLWFEVPAEYQPEQTKKPIKFLFPYEPMLDISRKNNIIKRYVLKGNHNGSVKEFFCSDDWEIRIVGTLINDDNQKFTKDDFQTLNNFFRTCPVIRVFCEPLQLLGILYICIESISFPFTKGENVQAYEITATSDKIRENMQGEWGEYNPSKPLLKEIIKYDK